MIYVNFLCFSPIYMHFFVVSHVTHVVFLFMIHVTNDMSYFITYAYDYECNMCVQVLISLLR